MKGRDLLLTLAVLLVLAPLLQAQTQPIQTGFAGGSVAAPIKFPDGVVGAPSITFTNETTTGIFRRGSAILSLDIAGSVIAETSSSVFRLMNDSQLAFSSALNATDTAFVHKGSASLSLSNAGTTAAAFQLTGSAVTLAVPAGAIGFATASTSSVGNTGQGARIVVVCGPTAGTASLLFYAGTTNTPVVLANAVGGGLIGC